MDDIIWCILLLILILDKSPYFDEKLKFWQEKGKEKAENRSTSMHDETMRAISGMDRVTQIEAVHAYNKLKKKLTEFLTTFVSNEQVITAKDVDTFFNQSMGKKE